MSMCHPFLPSHALPNSLKPRNIHRFAGVDVRNGLAMVQRQCFLSAPQWVTLFQLERILLYNFTFLRSMVRIGVPNAMKRFVWIREKAPKPRMVLNFLPVSLPKFTTLRDLTLGLPRWSPKQLPSLN